MIMSTLIKALAPAGIAAVLFFGTSPLSAQDQQGRRGRGDFDPEQMRQRMMERYRDALEVKSDDEWKVIQPRIEKVVEARAALGGGGGRFFGRPRGGNDGGGGGEQNRRGGRGGFGGFGEPSPEARSLQTAIDAKASTDEIKAKLAKLREANKQNEAKLAQAQDDLRKVLSVRQEAEGVLLGLLK